MYIYIVCYKTAWLLCLIIYKYSVIWYGSASQPGWVNQVMFYLGQPGLTRFINYPGLTRILHEITCVNNDILQWQCLGQCKYIMSIHFEKSHCWWCGSSKKSNKISLYVQVACTAKALTVLRSQTIWHARCLSMFHRNCTYNRNIDEHLARHMVCICETIPCI